MRLTVTVDGVDLVFVAPTVTGGYPWLGKVGGLHLAARAGHLEGVGVGEGANVAFELDNAIRQASDLLGYCPRAPAVIHDDNGVEWFSGLIQRVEYGAVLGGTIEA